MPSVQPHPDVPQTPDYVSPFGKFDGLFQRLLRWRAQLRRPGSHRPFYGGMAADLEVILRLLSLREFGEFLRTHGEGENSEWGDQILALLDETDDYDGLRDDIERVVPVKEGQQYAEAVEDIAKRALKYDIIRATLINAKVLNADDTDTDLADLIRLLMP